MERRKITIYIFIFIVLSAISCRNKNTDREQVVEKWQEQILIIPEDVEYKKLGRDIICPDYSDKSYKVLTYIDSSGCASCQFDLFQWKQFMDTCMAKQPSISFLFVFFLTDYDSLEEALIAYNFDYPIIYDRQNRFDKQNNFSQLSHNTFLLNKDNAIIAIGSPISSLKTRKLYMDIISGSQSDMK